MTDPDLSALLILATWAAFSLARIGFQMRRLAAAIEGLNDLAQKGRGR